MTRTRNRQISAVAAVAGSTHLQRLERQTFQRNLQNLLNLRKMSASDLARAVWGTIEDSRGYQVARNRDRISAYLAGANVPEPDNLRLIAEALGVTVEDLAPDIAAATVDRQNPDLSLVMVAGRSDLTHLVVNKLLPLSIATQIVQLIDAADRAARAGSQTPPPPPIQRVPSDSLSYTVLGQ